MKSFTTRLFTLALVLFVTHWLQAQDTETSSIRDSHSDGTHRWKTSTGATSFNVEYRGTIDLTDDDKDVKGMSSDGYLEISKTVFGSRRRIIIEALGGGKLDRSYWEGRNKIDWDPAGKQWLGEILPEIVRSTTLGAEGRVNRFYKKGGVPAVLAEINELKGDYVRSKYAKLLFEKEIPSKDLPNVINSLSNTIDSDYYLSSVFKDNINKLLSTQDAADAFFRGTDKIGSDYYKSVVIKEALKQYAASPAQVKTILQSASSINSDYYLSVVLSSLLESGDVKEQSLDELVTTSTNIESDYYRTEVLKKALKRNGISKATYNKIVSAVADVGSDYYKTTVFNAMAEDGNLEPEEQVQVVTIIEQSVESDYYASVTLKKMLEHQKLNSESFKALLTAAGQLGSSTYASSVLKEAAERNLDKAELLIYLKACQGVDSDSYLSDILMKVAPQVKSADNEVKEAYRAAAKRIGSDTYYGRTIKAID